MRPLMERLALPIMAVLMVGCSTPSIPRLAQDCFEASGRNFSEVLNCYKQAEAANPLSYTDRGSMPFPGGEVRHFILNSQRWSPDVRSCPNSGNTMSGCTYRTMPCMKPLYW